MKNKTWNSFFRNALSVAVKDFAKEMSEKPASKQDGIHLILQETSARSVGLTGSKKYSVKNAGML